VSTCPLYRKASGAIRRKRDVREPDTRLLLPTHLLTHRFESSSYSPRSTQLTLSHNTMPNQSNPSNQSRSTKQSTETPSRAGRLEAWMKRTFHIPSRKLDEASAQLSDNVTTVENGKGNWQPPYVRETTPEGTEIPRSASKVKSDPDVDAITPCDRQ
jgi:hypothetical protein